MLNTLYAGELSKKLPNALKKFTNRITTVYMVKPGQQNQWFLILKKESKETQRKMLMCLGTKKSPNGKNIYQNFG